MKLQSADGMLLVQLPDRWLAISPSDREGFRQAYVDVVRMGSLERIPGVRLRPDFLFNRVWADRWARALLLTGLAAALSLSRVRLAPNTTLCRPPSA